MWTAASPDGPLRLSLPAGGAVLTVSLLAAAITTVVHVARRTSGVQGVSDRAGAMYGWAWFLSFACLTVLLTAVRARYGLGDDVTGLLWTGTSGLVVGALYLAGGALWQDRIQYGIGVWVLVATAAGVLAGYPGAYLVMAFAGGGGFLFAALALAVRKAVP